MIFLPMPIFIDSDELDEPLTKSRFLNISLLVVASTAVVSLLVGLFALGGALYIREKSIWADSPKWANAYTVDTWESVGLNGLFISVALLIILLLLMFIGMIFNYITYRKSIDTNSEKHSDEKDEIG